MNARVVLVCVALVATVMIVGTQGDRKTCFCDLRYSTSRLTHRNNPHRLPVLKNLPNPVYRHWLRVGCRRVRRHCANDCVAKAHRWMGGSTFRRGSTGQQACESILNRNGPRRKKVYVYASYDPSVCGRRKMQYVAPLCCCKVSRRGFPNAIVFNRRCKRRCPGQCRS